MKPSTQMKLVFSTLMLLTSLSIVHSSPITVKFVKRSAVDVQEDRFKPLEEKQQTNFFRTARTTSGSQ